MWLRKSNGVPASASCAWRCEALSNERDAPRLVCAVTAAFCAECKHDGPWHSRWRRPVNAACVTAATEPRHAAKVWQHADGWLRIQRAEVSPAADFVRLAARPADGQHVRQRPRRDAPGLDGQHRQQEHDGPHWDDGRHGYGRHGRHAEYGRRGRSRRRGRWHGRRPAQTCRWLLDAVQRRRRQQQDAASFCDGRLRPGSCGGLRPDGRLRPAWRLRRQHGPGLRRGH
mmetsp:Transcript_22817/g.49848  ORF Transcript_22817/g.49848 Transcript_22817/m.49848 type:complete len:228 (-) Transcript_22817:1863-2546(-)